MLKISLEKNIFWKNGSYLKPNSIPDHSGFKEVPNCIPTMTTKYSGWVILNEIANYAYYDGFYYFLEEIKLIHQEFDNPVIKYAMVRDEWAEALNKKIRIKGTIARTNDSTLLNNNIQLTQSLIPEPAKLNLIKLIEVKNEEIKTTILEPNYYEYYEEILDKEDLEEFTRIIEKNPEESKYIEAIIGPRKRKSWKNLIVEKLKEFIKGFKNEEYQIGKLDNIASPTDILKTTWVLTKKNNSISTQKYEFQILELLDFSKLDISNILPLDFTKHNNVLEGNEDIKNITSKNISKGVKKVKLERAELFRINEGNYVYAKTKKPSDIYKVVNGELNYVLFDISKEQWMMEAKDPKSLLNENIRNLHNNLEYWGQRSNQWFYNQGNKYLLDKYAPDYVESRDWLKGLPMKGSSFDYEGIYDLIQGKLDYYTTYIKPFSSDIVTFLAPLSGSKTKVTFEDSRSYFRWSLWDWINASKKSTSKIHSSESIKKALLNDFYNGKEKIYSITEEQLKIGTHLFSLSGTLFNLIIHNGTPHLMFKDSSLLQPKAKIYKLDKSNLFNKGLYESINQRAIISIYNTDLPLKDKLTNNYDFKLYVKDITPDKITSFDYVWVKLQGYFDSINQYIEKPREWTEQAPAINIQTAESLLINIKRGREDLDLKKWEINTNRRYEDKQWNLRWQEHNLSYLNSITNIAIGAIGTGVSLFSGGFGAFSLPGFLGEAVGGVSSALSTSFQAKNIQQQYQHFLNQRVINNYSLDLTHHRQEEDFRKQIHWMSAGITTPPASSLDVLNKVNAELDIDPIHVKLWTPTDEQLKIIHRSAVNNGIECLITNVVLTIDKNLSGVWRFSHIDGIEAEDPMTLEYLQGLFSNGVKIGPHVVDFSLGESPEYLLIGDFQRKISQQNKEIDKLTTLIEKLENESEYEDEKLDDKRKQIKDLNDKLEQAKKTISTVRQNYEQKARELKGILIERNQLAEQKRDLQDELRECKKQLAERPEAEKLEPEDTKELKKKIKNLNDCLTKTREVYKYTHEKFLSTGKLFWRTLIFIDYIFAAVDLIVREMANNWWSNTKTWNWIKDLINNYITEYLKDVADAKLFIPAARISRPQKDFYDFPSKLGTTEFSELDKFVYWYLKAANIREFELFGKDTLKKEKHKSEDFLNFDYYLTTEKGQLHRVFPFMYDYLGTNYPAYKVNAFRGYRIGGGINDLRHSLENKKWNILTPEEINNLCNLEQDREEIDFNDRIAKIELEKNQLAQELSNVRNELNQRHEELNQKNQELTICRNNLKRVEDSNKELEQQKTQQENLANLYKAEADNLRAEKVQALKERDQARQEHLRDKQFLKTNPVTDAMIRSDSLLYTNAKNVGKNWADIIKYLHEIKRMELTIIQNKRSRQVPHGRTVRWLGDYLNYTIDSMVRIMRPYLGDNETRYAYSAKIPPATLNTLPDS